MGGPTLNAVRRLKKDYQKLIKDPVPYAIAAPLSADILTWQYVIFGAPETPYEGRCAHFHLFGYESCIFRRILSWKARVSGRFSFSV